MIHIYIIKLIKSSETTNQCVEKFEKKRNNQRNENIDETNHRNLKKNDNDETLFEKCHNWRNREKLSDERCENCKFKKKFQYVFF